MGIFKEVVYVTVGNLAFCLALYLTGVHFRGKLQHVGDVSEQKIKCRPIRTREIGGVRLQGELYIKEQNNSPTSYIPCGNYIV